MDVDGLPLVKPPYGTITAINLDKGEFVWQIAHGETPDLVRNSAILKGMNIPRTGQTTYNIGNAGHQGRWSSRARENVTTTADHPRGAMLRAYDKMTGKEVGAVYMPAPQNRIADDLHCEWKTVHRGGRQRRALFPANTLRTRCHQRENEARWPAGTIHPAARAMTT